jgi:predicted SnoaL-like aldol condensation-catalyzing enzyme
MHKVRILVTAMTLVGATGSANAQSPADGLTKNPGGIAAVEFLDLAINQNKVDEAAAKYLAPRYTQHNPQIPDGIDGVRVGIRGFIKQFPGLHLDFKRVIADGDLIIAVHSSFAGMGEHGSAVVDIFRVKDGKLVEHWDVIETVPATSVNKNTMF